MNGQGAKSPSPPTDGATITFADFKAWARRLPDEWRWLDGWRAGGASTCPAAQYLRARGFPGAVVGGITYSVGTHESHYFPEDGLHRVAHRVDLSENGRGSFGKGDLLVVIEEIESIVAARK